MNTFETLINSQEAGLYIGKSPAWLRANCQRLGIPSYKVGRQLRFRQSELDLWLEGNASK